MALAGYLYSARKAQYFKTTGRLPLPMACISGANFAITIVGAVG